MADIKCNFMECSKFNIFRLGPFIIVNHCWNSYITINTLNLQKKKRQRVGSPVKYMSDLAEVLIVNI